MPLPRSLRLLTLLALLCEPAASARADRHVVVSARADAAYTERKFGGPQVREESYVIGEGSFFGGITADRSLDRLAFRKIAESLAPELGRQHFWPAEDLARADLLIVIHWGVTTPHQSLRDAMDVTTLSFDPRDTPRVQNSAAGELLQEPSAEVPGAGDGNPWDTVAPADTGWQASPSFETIQRLSDEASVNFSEASNAQLLGYTKELRQLGATPFGSAEEATLRSDLSSERYLVILCAYDLKAPLRPGQRRRPVWVTHLNMRAPGTNFPLALHRMGQAGADFFGRTTDRPTTVGTKVREGHATAGPLIIIGTEEPAPPSARR